MTKWRAANIVLIVILVLVAGFASMYAWMTDVLWSSRYQSHVMDIGCLVSQYAQARISNGKWPDPQGPYGAFFHLRTSSTAGGKRIDTFSADADRAWLRIELGDDGSIWARVYLKEPGRD